MQQKVKKIGNSFYILIPKSVANAMGLKKGDVVDVDIREVR